MKISNEKLYEMIVEIRADMLTFKVEVTSETAEIKAAQSKLRADIGKWGVALFIGSIVAMTSIIGVFLASVMLMVAK